MAPLDLGRDPRWLLDLCVFGVLATGVGVAIALFQIQVRSSVNQELRGRSEELLGRELDSRSHAPVLLALANEETVASILKEGVRNDSLRLQYELTLGQAREKSRLVVSNYLLTLSGWTNHPREAADAVLDRFADKIATITPSEQRPWQVWTQHIRMTLLGRPLTGSEIRSDFLRALNPDDSGTPEPP